LIDGSNRSAPNDQWWQLYQTTADQQLKKTAYRNMRYFGRHPEVISIRSPNFRGPFTFISVWQALALQSLNFFRDRRSTRFLPLTASP
jgi:hypothetical protein